MLYVVSNPPPKKNEDWSFESKVEMFDFPRPVIKKIWPETNSINWVSTWWEKENTYLIYGFLTNTMYLTKKPPFQFSVITFFSSVIPIISRQPYETGERVLGKKAVLVFTAYSLKRYHRQNLTSMGQYGSISCLLQIMNNTD